MNECYECVNNDTVSCMFYNQCDKRKQRKRLITEFDIDCYTSLQDKSMCQLYGCEGENYG